MTRETTSTNPETSSTDWSNPHFVALATFIIKFMAEMQGLENLGVPRIPQGILATCKGIRGEILGKHAELDVSGVDSIATQLLSIDSTRMNFYRRELALLAMQKGEAAGLAGWKDKVVYVYKDALERAVAFLVANPD